MGQGCGCASGETTLEEISEKDAQSNGLHFTASPNSKKDPANTVTVGSDGVTHGLNEEVKQPPPDAKPSSSIPAAPTEDKGGGVWPPEPGSTADTVAPVVEERPRPSLAQVAPLVTPAQEERPRPSLAQVAPSVTPVLEERPRPSLAQAAPSATPVQEERGRPSLTQVAPSGPTPREQPSEHLASEPTPTLPPPEPTPTLPPPAEALLQLTPEPLAEAPPDPEALLQPTPQPTAEAASGPEAEKIEQLSGMGFDGNQARAALTASEGNLEQALAMIVSGAVPDEERPPPGPGGDHPQIEQLSGMGFDGNQARAALDASRGNLEQALAMLVSGAVPEEGSPPFGPEGSPVVEPLNPEQLTSRGFTQDQAQIEQLSGMGFDGNQARAALNASGGNLELAAGMLVRGEVPEEGSPPPGPGDGPSVDPVKLQQLTSMGFTHDQGQQALVDSGGDVQQATVMLLSTA